MDDLKADEFSLVEAYERAMSSELSENAPSSMASELQESAIEEADPTIRRLQKSQVVWTGLNPLSLKDLYSGMMRPIQQLDRKDLDFCYRILSTMTLAYRPLHLSELAIFAGNPNQIPLTSMVERCASFLRIREGVVQFVHQSAKDYLSAHKDLEIFPRGRAEVHCGIISRSLQVMSDTLGRDIYELRHPGLSIGQVSSINPDPLSRIRYACDYWVDHVCEVDSSLHSRIGLCDSGSIDLFLKTHFLHWLEALSLMRSVSIGVVQIQKLENLLSVSITPLTVI
jgi:hypothetical protein